MSVYTLWRLYSTAVMFLVLLIWSLERIIRRKSVIPRGVPIAEAKEETKKKINIVVKTVALCSAIFLNCSFTWPAVMDLPYVIEGEYLTVEGYTDSVDKHNAAPTLRGFYVKNEEERVYIQAVWRRVYKGVWAKVNYLPNSHFGTIVEWRE